MATQEEYLKALEELRQEYPYPMYNRYDLERILAQRGITRPQEPEEPEEPEVEEQEEEEDNGGAAGQRRRGMGLSRQEIHEIAEATAHRVMQEVHEAQEQIADRDMLAGMLIGEGAIPIGGREKKKLPCHGCRINPDKPFEAGNAMVNTEGAIGLLSKNEVRDWCSELIEVGNGRCGRARAIHQLARECKEKHPHDTQKYFECFSPGFRSVAHLAEQNGDGPKIRMLPVLRDERLENWIHRFIEERPESAFSPQDIQGTIAKQDYAVPALGEISKALNDLVEHRQVEKIGTGLYKLSRL